MTTHDTPAVRIVARRDGFRRMGMAHSASAVDHPAGTFSAKQIEALLEEPELVVTVDPTPERASGAGPTPPGPAPDPDAHRSERIVAAILELDPAKRSDWTKSSGAPTTAAIERVSGLKDASAIERNAAWAIVRARVARLAPTLAGVADDGKDAGDDDAGKDAGDDDAGKDAPGKDAGE